jgi:hypothetical protein
MGVVVLDRKIPNICSGEMIIIEAEPKVLFIVRNWIRSLISKEIEEKEKRSSPMHKIVAIVHRSMGSQHLLM